MKKYEENSLEKISYKRILYHQWGDTFKNHGYSMIYYYSVVFIYFPILSTRAHQHKYNMYDIRTIFMLKTK